MTDPLSINILEDGAILLSRVGVSGSVELTAEEFWRGLPEPARLALAKTAPQIIPAWEPYTLRRTEEERECRHGNGTFFAWFSKNVDGNMPAGFTPGWWRYGNSGGGAVGEKPTREEARAAADALVLAEGNRVLA